jgi:hypothetical protein
VRESLQRAQAEKIRIIYCMFGTFSAVHFQCQNQAKTMVAIDAEFRTDTQSVLRIWATRKTSSGGSGIMSTVAVVVKVLVYWQVQYCPHFEVRKSILIRSGTRQEVALIEGLLSVFQSTPRSRAKFCAWSTLTISRTSSRASAGTTWETKVRIYKQTVHELDTR